MSQQWKKASAGKAKFFRLAGTEHA
jgi:hypothetical protein